MQLNHYIDVDSSQSGYRVRYEILKAQWEFKGFGWKPRISLLNPNWVIPQYYIDAMDAEMKEYYKLWA